MTQFFPAITERRYKKYQRRYSNEYSFDQRRRLDQPDVTFKYSTLHAAKRRAKDAIDEYGCTRVCIFDHMTGQYVATYKKSANGISIHEGQVR